MKINIPSQEDIIEHYGATNQFGIHMEECSELIQAISKVNRAWNDWDKLQKVQDDVLEEIADVLICIEQLQEILNISDDDIESMIEYKTYRQIKRIQQDEEA